MARCAPASDLHAQRRRNPPPDSSRRAISRHRRTRRTRTVGDNQMLCAMRGRARLISIPDRGITWRSQHERRSLHSELARIVLMANRPIPIRNRRPQRTGRGRSFSAPYIIPEGPGPFLRSARKGRIQPSLRVLAPGPELGGSALLTLPDYAPAAA